MTKEIFKRKFEAYIEDEVTKVRVFVKMPDLPELEEIHNPLKNLEKKLEYYLKAYNDNMELNSFNEIKIVGLEYYNDFHERWI